MIKQYVFLLLGFVMTCGPAFSQMDIQVEIEDYEGDTLYLGFYYGKGKFFYDTAYAKSNTFHFSRDSSAPEGIYLVFDPIGSNYHDLILGADQKFKMNTTSSFALDQVRIQGSEQNEAFYEYVRSLAKYRPLADSLRFIQSESKEAKQALDEIDNLVKARQDQILSDMSGTILASIIQSGKEIDFPEFSGSKEEKQQQKYKYYVQHYFDNIDLSDDRILRTSFIHSRIETYLEKVVVRHPDSVIAAVDRILMPMRESAPELFKYYAVHLLNKYAKSKIVGFDAVYVHIVQEYYAKGYAYWVEESKLKKIMEEAEKLAPSLIGKKAPEITVQRLDNNEKISLYDIESPYTILYFWDPECGHCKKTTPKVVSFYENYKDSGIVLVAICTRLNSDAQEKCLDYIETKPDMKIFTNVYDPFLRSRYKQKYDIRATPKVFILDQDKKILIKNIAGEKLEDVMANVLQVDRELKNNKSR